MPLADTYDRQPTATLPMSEYQRGRDIEPAAQFLQRFVNKTPWVHLDIAGTAWSKKDAPTVPKGATAFGVRLLERFIAEYYEV